MSRTTVFLVGCGSIARHHLRNMASMRPKPYLAGIVDIDAGQRDRTRALLAEQKQPCPPFFDSVADFRKQGTADVALICTPHKYHLENTEDCLRGGMDVLLEKPMVMNADEARRLIRTRDRTGRLLMVAFPGSLSPAISRAKAMIRAGKIGRITAISASVYQQWKQGTTGTWRQVPALSGGGFLFDTGSHMVNTVLDLVGEDVRAVSATFDNRGTPVEILASLNGQFPSGAVFAMCADGESVNCTSRILIMGERGVIETGNWGERLNFIQPGAGEGTPVKLPKWRGVWQTFMRVREGKLANPCPPEVGLRFATFMDMARASATSGRTVRAKNKCLCL